MILRYEIFIVMVLVCAFFGGWIGTRSKSVVAGILSAWILISACMVCFNPQIVSDLIDMKLRVVAAKSFCLIVMGMFFMTILDRKWISPMLLFFEVIAVVQTILLLTVGYGMFGADSMDAAFVAVVYPINLFRPKNMPWWFKALLMGVPLLIFFAPRLGNTMFLVSGVSIGTYYLLKKRSLFPAFLSICIAVMLASHFTGVEFLKHADRTSQWKLFMQWLWESDKYILGSGTGTFAWIGPILQNKATDLFIWAHSEPIQILFEQGLPGLLLSLALIYQCLRLSIKTPWLFATSIGLITCSLTQFPLRYPVGQFFTLLLIRASLLEEAND